MVIELHVPGTQPVAPDELFVPRWTLVLRVARKHALNTHANALYVLDWTPTLSTEEIQADEAIRVDMRMHGNRPIGKLDESDLWRFYDQI